MKRIPTTAERRQLMRHTRTRSSLQDGVIVVRFIKVLPGPEPTRPPCEAEEDLRCSRCGAPNNYGENCDVCGDYMEFPPVGAVRPHCEISNCQEEANYHYNGGHYCAQHRPAPDYHGPEPEPESHLIEEGQIDLNALAQRYLDAGWKPQGYTGPERPEQWPVQCPVCKLWCSRLTPAGKCINCDMDYPDYPERVSFDRPGGAA